MNLKKPFRLKKTENDATGADQKAQQTQVEQGSREGKNQNKRKFRIRLIPIWLRLIIVILFMAISLVAGAMVGYGVLGDGDPMDVFEKETWQHVFDIVYKNVK